MPSKYPTVQKLICLCCGESYLTSNSGSTKCPACVKKAEAQIKTRKCLKCNCEFESQNSGNRLCPPCGLKNKSKKQTTITKVPVGKLAYLTTPYN